MYDRIDDRAHLELKISRFVSGATTRGLSSAKSTRASSFANANKFAPLRGGAPSRGGIGVEIEAESDESLGKVRRVQNGRILKFPWRSCRGNLRDPFGENSRIKAFPAE